MYSLNIINFIWYFSFIWGRCRLFFFSFVTSMPTAKSYFAKVSFLVQYSSVLHWGIRWFWDPRRLYGVMLPALWGINEPKLLGLSPLTILKYKISSCLRLLSCRDSHPASMARSSRDANFVQPVTILADVLLTSTPHNILSKPLAVFPHNHCRNNGQRWERNESCRNDYHQSSERVLPELGIEPATSCSQVRNATDCAMWLSPPSPPPKEKKFKVLKQ